MIPPNCTTKHTDSLFCSTVYKDYSRPPICQHHHRSLNSYTLYESTRTYLQLDEIHLGRRRKDEARGSRDETENTGWYGRETIRQGGNDRVREKTWWQESIKEEEDDNAE